MTIVRERAEAPPTDIDAGKIADGVGRGIRNLVSPQHRPALAGAAVLGVSVFTNDLTPWLAMPGWAASGWAATQAVTWWHRRRKTRRPRVADAVCYGCAGWLAAASAIDWKVSGAPTGIMLGSLALATAVFWVPRQNVWQTAQDLWLSIKRRLRGESGPVLATTAEVALIDEGQARIAELTAAWNARVRTTNLAELELVKIEPLGRYGWRSRIRLGDIAAEVVESDSTRNRIARAYNQGATNVYVSIDPDNAAEGNVMVLKENPLWEPQPWDGAGIRPDGSAAIGMYVSRTVADDYWFWNSSGAVHDLICGCTRAGKSEAVCQLLAMEAQCRDAEGRGLVASFLIDPQRGQSYAELTKILSGYANTVAQARELLAGLVAEMYRRNEAQTKMTWVDEDGWIREGVKTWTASAEMPLITITIDEAHVILADPTCGMYAQMLGAMGGKCGMKLRIVTQLPVMSSLGDISELADALRSGNIIVLRTGSSFTNAITAPGKLGGNPFRLPKTWPNGKTSGGTGYLASDYSKTEMVRLFYPGDVVKLLFMMDPETRRAVPKLPPTVVVLPDPAELAAQEVVKEADLADVDALDCRQWLAGFMRANADRVVSRAEILEAGKVALGPDRGFQTRTVALRLSELVKPPFDLLDQPAKGMYQWKRQPE